MDNTADIKSAQIAHESGYQVIPNTRNKAFAYAVIEGIRSTPDTDNIVVMDNDARHSVSVLSKMVSELERNEMVVASRWLKNEALPNSNQKRSLTNRITNLLAWPLARRIKDRTSGFLGFHKKIIDPATLNPNTTTIGLDIITNGRYSSASEVLYPPVHEGKGDSKAPEESLFSSLKHLFSLYMSKYQILNFMIVGGIGYVINISIMTILIYWPPAPIFTMKASILGQHYFLLPFVISSLIAIACNYLLNKIWTFKGWSEQSAGFLRYLSMALATLLLDIAVLSAFVDLGHLAPVLAAALAIAIVFVIRYLIARKWVWARK
jgi:putative flippase GtrA